MSRAADEAVSRIVARFNHILAATIRQMVTVQPGGVVRIQSDQLEAGTTAEVLVQPVATGHKAKSAKPMSWQESIGSGVHTGRTVEEIDRDLRGLRNDRDR